MVRQPVVAGQFYELNFQELENQIKRCFTGRQGPGTLPLEKRQGTVKGIIAPHAGFAYSGSCAAWAYKEIAEAEFPDVFIMLGFSHRGLGDTSTMMDDWITPLGMVKCDKDLTRLLKEKTGLVLNDKPFLAEHSIEVQLPFLQFASRDRLQDLRIVPISLSHTTNVKKFALDLKEAIMDSGKRVCIIASSDFTHYGPAYGYIPFELDKQKKLYELDNKAIRFIKQQDVDGFLKFIFETGATICGSLGISVLMATLPKSDVRLLQYYTSGDIQGDYRNAVGYASIVFR